MRIYYDIMRQLSYLTILAATILMTACGSVTVPDNYSKSDSLPKIYPDYVNVTVPYNIAPLTFELDEEADNMIVRYSFGDQEILCEEKAQPAMDEWHQLTAKAKGKAIKVEVFEQKNDQWTLMKPFSINVSPDPIDPYISYRLISPSYVTYEELSINQRCLENYDESVIYSNMLCSTEKDGQCINCHNYQQYNPDRMLFHARQNLGGTVIAYDGEIQKIDMKNDSIISAGVYPTWHPTMKYIVFSTNKTGQSFHTRDLNKIEVFDAMSDLIAYDLENNTVTNIENRPDEFEVYPFWAPDGKTLYFCSAHFEYNDSIESKDADVIFHAKEVRYNIYKKSFDPKTKTFGERETVFVADTLGKSATLPRISPDGRYLMFTLGAYGCFHIWHHDADLYLMDLQTGDVRAMDEINSDDTESYHSWSSNGRWVIFSSRRDDGGYTRPFMAHIDKNGVGSKPFELPSADPDYHRLFMKSYNIPEFMKGPVKISPQTFASKLKKQGTPVTYVSTYCQP